MSRAVCQACPDQFFSYFMKPCIPNTANVSISVQDTLTLSVSQLTRICYTHTYVVQALFLEAIKAVAPCDGRSACSATGSNYLQSQHWQSRQSLPNWTGLCSTLRPTNDVSPLCTDSPEILRTGPIDNGDEPIGRPRATRKTGHAVPRTCRVGISRDSLVCICQFMTHLGCI